MCGRGRDGVITAQVVVLGWCWSIEFNILLFMGFSEMQMEMREAEKQNTFKKRQRRRR